MSLMNHDESRPATIEAAQQKLDDLKHDEETLDQEIAEAKRESRIEVEKVNKYMGRPLADPRDVHH